MIIENNTVVQFKYKLSDANKTELEQSDEKVPMAYLHGHNNLLGGLEVAMEGKKAGDQFSVELEPKDAYGDIQANSEQRIPIKHCKVLRSGKRG